MTTSLLPLFSNLVAHFSELISWIPIDQVISGNQRTQGNKGQKGMSLVQNLKVVVKAHFIFVQDFAQRLILCSLIRNQAKFYDPLVSSFNC